MLEGAYCEPKESPADADISVFSSRPFVGSGESFAYIITVKNTGGSPLSRCVISGMLHENVRVVKLEVEGEPAQCDFARGVEIKNIACGQSVVMIATAEAGKAVCGGVYRAAFNAAFEAVSGESAQSTSFAKSAQHKEGVKIIMPKLTLLMSVDHADAAVAETITYTIVAKNDGNVTLGQVVVVNSLLPQLKFQKGTVSIDGVRQEHQSIVKGIALGDLGVGEIKTICFEAQVMDRSEREVLNRAKGAFEYHCEAQGQPQCDSTLSNPVSLRLFMPRLSLYKTVDKPVATLGDTLLYTVKIANDGDIPAYDVLLIDRLPPSLELVEGSFCVDQAAVYGENLSDGINLQSIAPGGCKTVEYRAKVVDAACGATIRNEAVADFSYGVKKGRRSRMLSQAAAVELPVAICLFRQVCLKKSFSLPEKKPDIKHINNVRCNAKVEQSYVVETPKGISQEGQKLTGYNLTVLGQAEFCIEYTANKDGESVHFATCRLPLCTSVTLPPDCNKSAKRDVSVFTEGIYYNTSSPKEFFVCAFLIVTCGMEKGNA